MKKQDVDNELFALARIVQGNAAVVANETNRLCPNTSCTKCPFKLDCLSTYRNRILYAYLCGLADASSDKQVANRVKDILAFLFPSIQHQISTDND